MAQMFVLSQKDPGLAEAEVSALLDEDCKLYDYILITESDKQLQKRLAFTRFFYKFLFHCKEKDLKNKIKTFDWNKYYKYSFCIRKFGSSEFQERDLADLIWERINNPNVELNNPNTRFDFYFTDKRVFCGLFQGKGRTDFDKRLPKLRPGMHPTTMKPRLAACLVNLTGIKSGTIYDPMCGTGGILVESIVMGFKAEGSDIDERMLDWSRQNLDFYKMKAKLFRLDATKIKKRYNYVVTDLPYAKGTITQDLKLLYSKFLSNLKKVLRKRAVIVFPSFIRHRPLIKKAGLNLKSEYSYYLHKSLSRTVCVIEP
jgi:tRNA (guanine10-N2)-dimethyltransferase